MVSGEENTSRGDNREREPTVEATAAKTPAQGDLTEVKKMLEDFLTEQKKQAKKIEENSNELKALSRRKRERPSTARLRARVDPQRLDFSAPRTTRGNPEDLPPPPQRRETDKFPERVVDVSDEEEPAPAKRTRSEERYKKEQERRRAPLTLKAHLAAVKAQMDRVTSDLKHTQSQMHQRTGKAPAITQEMSLNTPTTIQDALHRACFKQLKEYLATPPILAKPVTGEPLFLYIAVSETAVSVVLVREERGEQKPIFYVSKTLTDAEARYPQLEKLALSIVMASRKLRPYFQSHTIVILSTFPLRTVLHSPSQSSRLAKWAIELSEYDIEYKGRTCNKSQVLADFLIELPENQSTKEVRPGIWELHVDGSSSKNGSGVGIRLASPTGEILEQSFRLGFRASNNEAKYEAIIAGMRLAQGLNIEHVRAFCDSQLVSNQFSGEYATKEGRMEAYQKIVKDLASTFKEFTLTRIPRGENVDADALANLASASAPPKDPTLKRVIPVEVIEFPSINKDMTLAISTRSQAAKQTEATTETRVDDVEMTEVEANTEPAPSTTPTSDANAIGPEVIGADVAEAEDPEDLRQPARSPEELPTQNLPLEPIQKDMTIPMDTDEEPEYGCDKPWIDQIRAYIVSGKLPNSKWAARK
ncbi:hypothetical protein AALP_AAs68488U001400, partial [Arabis alpina]